MSDYRVTLDIYNGPLDLLLYLIRREEVDIYDIPISHIANQFMEQVELMRSLDPNMAGEFLVMAATLMEIKTRMLLPAPPPEEDGDDQPFDPRGELVRQLLEYKAFKDAAGDLWHSAIQQAMSHPRTPAKPERGEQDVEMADLQVWDLMDAFNRVLAEIGQDARTHDVVYDDTPIELHERDIMDMLARDGRVTFRQIFAGRATRGEIVGLFLAMLQLVAHRQILVSQGSPTDEISVELNPNPPDAEQLEIEEAAAAQRAAAREAGEEQDAADAAGEAGGGTGRPRQQPAGGEYESDEDEDEFDEDEEEDDEDDFEFGDEDDDD